jgi:hypothetical protein
MRIFDPSIYGFNDQSVDLAGTSASGGESLSGLTEYIDSDGGGYVTASFSDATLISREANLAWRAFNTGMHGGSVAAVVLFEDRRHQPVNRRAARPRSTVPLPDLPLRPSDGAIAHISALLNGQAGGLRCTRMAITSQLVKPLQGGEWFTIVHPTWGERAYNISLVQGNVIEFLPPLREATAAGTFIDFDNPRCRMVRVGQAPNPLSMKRAGQAGIQFVEDMRKPS